MAISRRRRLRRSKDNAASQQLGNFAGFIRQKQTVKALQLQQQRAWRANETVAPQGNLARKRVGRQHT
jgi:hypothetical protein